MARRKPEPEFKHPPPRKQVLLLSCMDCRLLDNVIAFMNTSNLANRYDQVVFAGASLGVMQLASPSLDGAVSSPATWKEVFFHHLQVAIDVLHRPIKDIYLMEHRDCGAYEHFHPTHNYSYGDDPAEQELEEKHHSEQAFLLARTIREFCHQQLELAHSQEKHARSDEGREKARKKASAWKDIKVRCFLMDLHGDVKHLKEE